MPKATKGRGSERRAAMGVRANEVPNAVRGRTTSSTTPVIIRDAMAGDGTLRRDWVHERLGFALGKFAWRIDRVSISVHDESGPHGRPTARATITLSTARTEPVVVTARAATSHLAVSAAMRSCERALRRRTERARAR